MKKFVDTKAFARIIKRVQRVLQGYKYCLIGGRAVEMHANPPQTPDCDFLVKFRPMDIRQLKADMATQGFELIREFGGRDYTPMLFFKDTVEKDAAGHVEIDLIGAFEDVQFWAIERSRAMQVGGVKLPVAQAEDVVILKANAACSPRREKRERDIAAIEAIRDEVELDTGYIETVLNQALADWGDEIKLLKKLKVLE